MVNIDDLTSAFSGVGSQTMSTLMAWLVYIFWAVVIIGILYAIYVFFQYKIVAEIFIRRNTGDGSYSIGAIKNTRIREFRQKGVRKWGFFMKKNTMDPLDDKYILPGNRVKLLKVGDTFTPMNLKCGKEETFIEPIPNDIKLWQSLEMSQAASEYQDLKSKLTPLFMVMGTVLFCCILVGVVAWLSYKHTSEITASINYLANTWDLASVAQSFKPGG